MIKKILAFSVCLLLSVSMLTACKSKGNSSSGSSSGTDESSSDNSGVADPSETMKLMIDGEEVDTDGLIMCTIDGFDITYDEFRYYWLFYYDQMQSLGYDFDTDADDVLSLIKYNTIKDLSNTYAMMGLARDNSLSYTVSETDLQTAYAYQMMQFEQEEDYFEFLDKNHMTDTALQCLLTSYIAYDTAYSDLFEEGGKYFVDNDGVIEAFQSDKMARCVHVLIPFSACVELSDETKESWDAMSITSKYSTIKSIYESLSEDEKDEVAKKSLDLANEVHGKAEAGEDFFSLIEQYNYDPGMMPPEGKEYSDVVGYYFTKDYNYVEEFINGTFALEENEISPVITSEDYGYHIIKRLPIDLEYVEANIEELAAEYNEINSQVIFYEHLDNIDITYSEYFDKLTLDSIT